MKEKKELTLEDIFKDYDGEYVAFGKHPERAAYGGSRLCGRYVKTIPKLRRLRRIPMPTEESRGRDKLLSAAVCPRYRDRICR